MFSIGGGRVVNFWSNGDTGGGLDYGVAVATPAQALDYVSGGVSAAIAGGVSAAIAGGVSEPSSLWLLAGAALGLLTLLRRSASA